MRLSSTQEFLSLHAAYREAWKQFSTQFHLLQSLEADDSDGPIAIQAAREAARRTEERYRASRNLLADYVLSSSTRGFAAGLATPEQRSVFASACR